jgi:hypothetical protein
MIKKVLTYFQEFLKNTESNDLIVNLILKVFFK